MAEIRFDLCQLIYFYHLHIDYCVKEKVNCSFICIP